MGTKKTTETEFNVLQFEKQLITLKDSQEAINHCCQWCLQNRTHHKKIVNSWLNVLKRVKVEQRLILFYLANDVVQYSKRRNYEYVESWGIALQKATTMVRDEKVKHKILRIFKIWEQRGVYNEEFISDLCGLLSVLPSAPKSDEPHEFQSNYVINKIKTCSKLETDTDTKMKLLKEHNPKIHIDDGLMASLKERANVDDVEKEIEVYITHMEDYINALKVEIKNRITLISVLKQAETQLEADRKDVKVVANAYKMFGARVKTFQRKLEEHKETLNSPIPSPDVNAPSPSPDSDIDLPDDAATSTAKDAVVSEYNPKTELQFSAGYYTPVSTATENTTTNSFLSNGVSSFIGTNFGLESFQTELFGNSPAISPSTAIQNPPLPVAAPNAVPLTNTSYSYGSSSHMPLMPPPMPPFGKTDGDYNSTGYNQSYSTTTATTTYDNSYTTTPYETSVDKKSSFLEDSSFQPPLGANPYPPNDEYNPEEDVSTWEPDPSWNGDLPANPDADTPESPPMFEKEGYRDPVEYHDNLLTSGAVDVDHRVIPGVSGDMEDSMSSLGGKDIDHRNLISLTGSPGNSTSANANSDQDYRVPPSGGVATVVAVTATPTQTADQDYRLGFNIEQLKLPPPPPPPPKNQDEKSSTGNTSPPRNESSEDMDMEMSDDEGRHKNNENLKVIIGGSKDQQYSLEPPPPLPDLPDDEDANNFLNDLSGNLHEFGNLTEDLDNAANHNDSNTWERTPLMPPPPLMNFGDLVGGPMIPPPPMDTSFPPPPPPRPGNMLMNQPPPTSCMPLPPPPQPWMSEEEQPPDMSSASMDQNHYENNVGDNVWANDDYGEMDNWDKPPLPPPNEWMGPPPMNNNFGGFRARGNNNSNGRGNVGKRGRGRGSPFNRNVNFRGGGPRGGGRGRGGGGGGNRGFFPREMFAATVSRIAPKIQPLAVQTTRNMTVISGPPQVKVSTLEQIAHGVAITFGLLAIPGWVLVNIKNYRGVSD